MKYLGAKLIKYEQAYTIKGIENFRGKLKVLNGTLLNGNIYHLHVLEYSKLLRNQIFSN